MPAVLLGGALNALSVARSLDRLGVSVDVFDEGLADSPVRHSRSRRSYVELGPDQGVADQWYARLMEHCEPSVILPCCDDGLELIARQRSAFESVGHKPAEANDEIVLTLLDKARTYELAREVGIPAPRTTQLVDRSDLDLIGEDYFPCGIKPVNAHVFSRRFHSFAKGTLVRTRQDLVRLVEPILDEGVPMLLMEMVEGTDECCSYYSYLEPDGTPLTHITKRKLRQYPTRFGLGSYHLTKWDPEVAELGLRFFQGVGLRGMGNVEFKRDARDATLKLIESNPRFTHANELVRVAGIDLAQLVYNRAAGVPGPPLGSCRDNVGMWFPLADVRALREYRRRGELSTVTWFSTLLHRQCAPQFAWTDPRPSLANGARHAARLVSRVAARGRSDGWARRPRDPYGAREGTPSR